MTDYPMLKGDKLFRRNELVYINRSDELREYCNIIHKHDFIEIAYVISGRGLHLVADRQYETARGDLFVINFDVPHGFFAPGEGAPSPVVYNCVFMPQFLDASLFSASHFEDITSSFLFKSLFPDDYPPQPDLKLSGAPFHEVETLFAKMHTEYQQMNKGYTDLIRAYLIELIVKIFRYTEAAVDGSVNGAAREAAGLTGHPAARPDNRKTPGPRHRELIDRAIAYMKMNYKSEISLSDLALRSFISKNYFSRLFKEVTGSNVSDYIQYLRTEQACTLLKTTDWKVADIAFQVGFSDLKFFYEVFKKITGKTPGDYRKKD